MFQVEPILWLQGFASPGLTWAMSCISLLGYTPVYVALVLALAFGIRLRPGLGVLVALLLGGVTTHGLKSGLALPRPSQIDARVLDPGDSPSHPVVERGGATAFWALPAPEAIAAIRAQPEASYGFPSGHVSSAAAFACGVALFFGPAKPLAMVLVWPLLMSVSRMYLGRHFLADVVGGLAIGALAAGVAAILLKKLDRPVPAGRFPVSLLVITGFGVLLAVWVPWNPRLDPGNVGRLAGLAAAYLVLLTSGMPADQGALPQRCGRVVLAALTYVGAGRLIDTLFEAAGWDSVPVGELAAAALTTAATLLGGVAIARRLRLYVAA
jgi:membrane-associated phospholipid phosphatase